MADSFFAGIPQDGSGTRPLDADLYGPNAQATDTENISATGNLNIGNVMRYDEHAQRFWNGGVSRENAPETMQARGAPNSYMPAEQAANAGIATQNPSNDTQQQPVSFGNDAAQGYGVATPGGAPSPAVPQSAVSGAPSSTNNSQSVQSSDERTVTDGDGTTNIYNTSNNYTNNTTTITNINETTTYNNYTDNSHHFINAPITIGDITLPGPGGGGGGDVITVVNNTINNSSSLLNVSISEVFNTINGGGGGTPLLTQIGDTITNVTSNVNVIGGTVTNIANSLTTTVGDTLTNVTNNVSSVMNTVNSVTTQVNSLLGDTLTITGGIVNNVTQTVGDTLTNVTQTANTTLNNLTQTVGDTLNTTVNNTVVQVGGILENVTQTVTNVTNVTGPVLNGDVLNGTLINISDVTNNTLTSITSPIVNIGDVLSDNGLNVLSGTINNIVDGGILNGGVINGGILNGVTLNLLNENEILNNVLSGDLNGSINNVLNGNLSGNLNGTLAGALDNIGIGGIQGGDLNLGDLNVGNILNGNALGLAGNVIGSVTTGDVGATVGSIVNADVSDVLNGNLLNGNLLNGGILNGDILNNAQLGGITETITDVTAPVLSVATGVAAGAVGALEGIVSGAVGGVVAGVSEIAHDIGTGNLSLDSNTPVVGGIIGALPDTGLDIVAQATSPLVDHVLTGDLGGVVGDLQTATNLIGGISLDMDASHTIPTFNIPAVHVDIPLPTTSEVPLITPINELAASTTNVANSVISSVMNDVHEPAMALAALTSGNLGGAAIDAGVLFSGLGAAAAHAATPPAGPVESHGSLLDHLGHHGLFG